MDNDNGLILVKDREFENERWRNMVVDNDSGSGQPGLIITNTLQVVIMALVDPAAESPQINHVQKSGLQWIMGVFHSDIPLVGMIGAMSLFFFILIENKHESQI